LRDVITVGGVHVDGQGLKPSDLTSSFDSLVEPDRHVPDVCGLAGLQTQPYILVPVPPGSEADAGGAAGEFPLPPDRTDSNDGWAFTSKSSGATAQLAAVVGLIRAANPDLDPKSVKELLMANCSPVGPGTLRNNATGSGLIRGGSAVEAAKARRS